MMGPKRAALVAACSLALGLSSVALSSAPALAAQSGGLTGGFYIGAPSGGGSSGGVSTPTHKKNATPVEVGKAGGFRYHTISAGIKAAGHGGLVRVHPGIYVESLKVTKPVTILGLVDAENPQKNMVQIQAPADEPCLHVKTADAGFVSIRQIDLIAGSRNVQRSCVELISGYLSIKDTTIRAPNYVSAVLARGGHLSIETTNISGGREGVLITSVDGDGTYYIFNSWINGNITGIQVAGLAQANIVGNQINNNSNNGVVYYQGRGSIIGNEIGFNNGAGIVLYDSPQSPTVRANNISENVGAGIEIAPAVAGGSGAIGRPIAVSKGVICDNSITNNFGVGIDSKAHDYSINCHNEVKGNQGDRPRKKKRSFFGG